MLNKIEELALIARCVATDDRNAFGRLVDAYSPGLHGFLFNLTMGDTALTDDLAQETFLKAYMAIRSFKGVAKFKTWLYRIAINEYYTSCRKRKEESIDNVTEYSKAADKDDHRLTEVRYDVATAMKCLNDTERTLILLFYFDDLPIKEISKITSMPEGTIKSYLSRAKNKMSKILNPQ